MGIIETPIERSLFLILHCSKISKVSCYLHCTSVQVQLYNARYMRTNITKDKIVNRCEKNSDKLDLLDFLTVHSE
jgi:hypothetical protein